MAEKLQNDCLAGWDSKEQLSSMSDRFAPPVFSKEAAAEPASANLDDAGRNGDFGSLSHEAVNREFVKLKPDVQTPDNWFSTRVGRVLQHAARQKDPGTVDWVGAIRSKWPSIGNSSYMLCEQKTN